MSVHTDIEARLTGGIKLLYLQVVDESANHNVAPGSESHFKIVAVSNDFLGMSLLDRHRLINALLADELRDTLHALAIHAYTEAEWRERFAAAPFSPPCRGGGGAKRADGPCGG